MDAVAVVYLGDIVDLILPASTMVTAALTYLSHKKDATVSKHGN